MKKQRGVRGHDMTEAVNRRQYERELDRKARLHR